MSRHIPRQRIPSGIVFSAPLDLESAPRDIQPVIFDPIPDQTPKTSHPASHGKRHIVRDRHESDHIDRPGRPFGDGIHTFSAFFNTFDEPHVPRKDLQDSAFVGADHHEAMTTLCLPMLSVDIEVTVDGTLACSELTQTFRNPSDTTIREAKHTFPLYEGATVTAFECTIGDEQCLRGVVKPKEEARQVYHEAVENKRETAALLEEQSSEIFVTSLGNIPPLTDVKIKLTYVHELKVVLMTERKSEGIAIIIPTSIAPRYGVSFPSQPLRLTELNLVIRVAAGSITDSEGWTAESHHSIDYQGREPMKRVFHVSDASQLRFVDESPSACQQQDVWKYHSREAGLEGDLVLVLPVRTGYRVQSRALISPPDFNGYAAMQVSFRPSDLFGTAVRPRSFTGEIIFVLDYSGSMHLSRQRPQSKLEVLGAAMSLALCGIPDTCAFNVLKFGSSTEGLWDESRPHSAETIELARAYTTSRPNLGGTDLVRALKAAVKHVDSQRSSAQIIIITDGELDPMPVAEYLSLIRKKLGNKLRFFALGIGDHVSHRLIECVAELGGGLGDVVDVVAQPKWENRLNHLVRAALEPDSWNCEINLGPTFERQSLACVQSGKDYPSSMETKSPTPYIQASFPIPDLHPFSYKTIYFLIYARNEALPRDVTVTSTHPTAKSKSYKLAVQIRSVNGCFPHQLAARSYLTNLETLAKREHSDHGLVRASAEHLGQTYSIASKWTSFVTEPHGIEDELSSMESTVYQKIAAQLDIEKAMRDYVIADEEGEFRGSQRERHCSPIRDIVCANYPTTGLLRTVLRKILSSIWGRGPKRRMTPLWKMDKLPRPVTRPEALLADDFHTKNEEESSRSASTVPSTHTNRDQEFLTWEHAVTDQMPNGTFRLLDTVRQKLGRHYCPTTAVRIREMVLALLHSQCLSDNPLQDCTDTIMMISYFRTHMSPEEDTWGLMMSRAESALLATLGYSDEDEDQLEPIYDMLQLSSMHQHFRGFQQSRNTELAEQAEDETGTNLKCPVCDELFGMAAGVRRYFCPYEEDEDGTELSTELQWDSWLAYWDHQVQTGHVLCSKVGVLSDA
ncbi:VIT and vWA domain-containing protein [Aspergillus fijiensis CBS 313.89]|uniref:VIT-domain-containing protein n=1 Tax=Aspergillus fijiensis CBS 313.89 TaxID=1448319 RepID=A0A8G1W1W7_9EURO|nr:VIT-domain-containing protein [Aspergillus fijiensis CBS 313.89]RAK77449.1 VIT-domain-containing protein [Aspergillus fijiensis CBS 313.89]